MVETNAEAGTAIDVRADLGRNSSAIAAARVISALTALIAVPFVINELGLARFGLWESLVAMSSLTALVTDSVGGTLLWRMSLAWGQGDFPALRRFVRTGVAVSLALFVLLVPVALLLRPTVARFLRAEPADTHTIENVLVALVALVFLSGVNATLGALNSAQQRVSVTAFAQTAGQITMYVVSIFGLRIGQDLLAMVGGVAAGQAITSAVLIVGGRGRQTVPRPMRAGISIARRMSTARYFAVLSVGGVGAFLRGQTDRLVLAGFATPIWAGYYGIAARLSNLLVEVSNLFYVPTIAAAGALTGASRWGGVRVLYQRSMLAVSVASSIVGLVLIGLADPLVLLWVGSPVPEAGTILRILAVGTLVAVAITGPGTAICKGIGRPDIELRYVAASLAINLVLTVGLVLVVGPIGSVVASSLSWAAGGVYFVWVFHKSVSAPHGPIRRAVATLVATGAAVTVLLMGVALVPGGESPRDALLVIIAGIALGLAVLFAISGRIGGATYNDVVVVCRGFVRRFTPRSRVPARSNS